MAIVTTAAWIGMGFGSYQAGFFYDARGTYVLSYGVAAAAGIFNLGIVSLLYWFLRSQVSRYKFA